MKLARQWAALLAGLLALPSAISGAGFSADNWERAVSSGTTHNSITTTPVDTTTHPTHDLSGMVGSTAATYEFVVNVPQTDQFSPVLLGDNVWWLKFDQESAPSTQVNQLGVTKRNLLVPSPSNYRSYYETHRFNQFNETIWSMTGGSGFTDDDVNEAIKLATAKTNITGFVMDDFFIGGTRLSTDDLDSIRARIRRELGWSSPNLYGWFYMTTNSIYRLTTPI